MTVKSNYCLGIYPGDIIIRTALLTGLADLRKNPFLLDFVFQSLLRDPITKNYYGEGELEVCKQWFLDNEIPITLGYHADSAKLPHITIWLGDQQEADKILGDIHDKSSEEIDLSQVMTKGTPALVFTPLMYDIASGTITLPTALDTSQVFSGMRVFDSKNNKHYLIEEVIDSQTFKIPDGSKPNLTKAQVVNANDLYVVQLESITFRDSYKIEISVMGDATKVIVLHSILVFVLNRYKQSLLEGRGFERSTITSAGMQGAANGPEASQWIFMRSIQLTGYVRQYWPKSIAPAVQGLGVAFQFDSGPNAGGPDSETAEMKLLEELQGWETVPFE